LRKFLDDPTIIHTFKHKGLLCVIRYHHVLGILNGYVILPKAHRLYKRKLDILISVHGGITFDEYYAEGRVEGFDTAHAGDYVPVIATTNISKCKKVWKARDVIEETKRLAEQL